MEKWQEVKKNHHYVWAHYLKNWATGRNVYYLTKKRKVAFDSVKGLCKESGFYTINPLLPEDIAYIKRWINKASGHMREQHEKDLELYAFLSKILLSIENNGGSKNLDRLQNIIRQNSLENAYAVIEKEMIPVISELNTSGMSTLSDPKNMITFCSYLGHQITRTKLFKNSLQQMPEDLITTQFKEANRLMKKNWWFLSYMFGNNIAASLFLGQKDYQQILIKNDSKRPFITGEHPVVNVHQCISTSQGLNPPEYMDLFFPLSPNLGYMFNQSTNYNHLTQSIQEHEVDSFNLKIASQSDGFIIGNTKEIVDHVRSSLTS